MAASSLNTSQPSEKYKIAQTNYIRSYHTVTTNIRLKAKQDKSPCRMDQLLIT